MARKLRIAFSVMCGIACLLLVALWVRSYWVLDSLYGPQVPKNTYSRFAFNSGVGEIMFNYSGGPLWPWRRDQSPIDEGHQLGFRSRGGALGFAVHRHHNLSVFYLPYWFTVLVVSTLVVAPWLPYHFSLRTLLIATTLVAVVLGLIVWAAR